MSGSAHRAGDGPSSRLLDRIRELFTVDLRSLAALRIGLGVSVVADVLTRSADFFALYTDTGVLPRDLLVDLEGPGIYFSVHYWASQHSVLQGLLFALAALAGVALALGWRTRAMTVICWYLTASLQLRQPLAYMGGDSILRLLLFWGLFLPLGGRWSRDARRPEGAQLSDRFFSGASVALLLQVCLIYWVTGLRKTGELWWSGEAVFYALHLDEWATPVGVWLRQFTTGLTVASYATLGLECLGPFLVFVPFRNSSFRLLAIVLFWTFHAGLALAMNIGLFPLFSMVAWLAFVPGEFWSRLGSATMVTPVVERSLVLRLQSIVASVLLVYVVVLLAERSRLIPRVVPAPVTAVGTALRIQQSWSMFAPDPTTATTAFEARQTLGDGTAARHDAANGFRWTVLLGRALRARDPDDPLWQTLSKTAGRFCDAGVAHVALVANQRAIGSEGFGPTRSRVVAKTSCPPDADRSSSLSSPRR